MSKGHFIVFEGCDRSGKTTQVKLLSEYLQDMGIPCKTMCFPNRETPIGKLINSYLNGDMELDSHAVHLLFSANRYEMKKQINDYMDNGITVIMDRYIDSGYVFGKINGCDMEWCRTVDSKMPIPDYKIFLDLHPEHAARRELYGIERYENLDFQNKVYRNFMELIDSDIEEGRNKWIVFYANCTINELKDTICTYMNSYIF